jgi:hypothetical protein
MFCRRLVRRRRLSLHGANTGKSDCEEESKESFSHGREANQTAGLQSTHFQGQPIFNAERQQNRCAFASQNARECDASAEAQRLEFRKLTRERVRPNGGLSLVERGRSLR